MVSLAILISYFEFKAHQFFTIIYKSNEPFRRIDIYWTIVIIFRLLIFVITFTIFSGSGLMVSTFSLLDDLDPWSHSSKVCR